MSRLVRRERRVRLAGQVAVFAAVVTAIAVGIAALAMVIGDLEALGFATIAGGLGALAIWASFEAGA